MSQATYDAVLAGITNPTLRNLLPGTWPTTAPRVDRARTLAPLRRAAATRNRAMMLIGYGDGTATSLLADDPVCRDKQIHVLVLPHEIPALAHDLGDDRGSPLVRHPRLTLQVSKTLHDAKLMIMSTFGRHADIAALSGMTIVADHPLVPEAERERSEWLPALNRQLSERLDCIGNDVYDTFMGAKHALMHGRGLAAHRRTSHLAGRFAGRSALCLASGPSTMDHLERIREIQREHVVIVADSFLGGALAAGIEPDFVCMVERPEEMHRLIDEHAGRTAATLVALPLVHPASVKPFGERVAWWWNSDDLYPWLKADERQLISGRSAGTATIALAGHLGCSHVYLIGHDLSFRDGRSHAAGTHQMAVQSQTDFNKTLTTTSANYYQQKFEVPRNGGGMVETFGLWNIFRGDIELLIASRAETCFINANVGCGAVIAGAASGPLPTTTGAALDKSLPPFAFDQAYWDDLRPRAARLTAEMDEIAACCSRLSERVATAKPLSLDADQIESIAQALDIEKMVSPENRRFFTYVLRAAHRNLMLRMHHNTHVRTLAERDWNQVQVIRLYLQTLPGLVQRLRAELATATEGFA